LSSLERFIAGSVYGDDPGLASYLRIEERALNHLARLAEPASVLAKRATSAFGTAHRGRGL
jgi:hypothetical protein